MDLKRTQRVGEEIQKEISSLLLNGLKDPRIGFVTITNVDVTADLQIAKVYFTVMGDETARKNSEKGLNSSIPFIRRELGKRLRLRHVPDIVLKYDTSLEYGNRIESLLKDIQTESSDDSENQQDN
ncbi:ribosome-binding factor A [Desulfuromonas sp. AOP6]|uniref:ribosome-binding factor A n=1 Tax=Desulfuromonas sp. AOP6 TaxID=1566351 RepID=UPI001277AAC6|nr:ribosome-binding factor A [Desulfuromonas sp. AOP6]BCA79520.1 ribosome-binding factor A [Desulfuromonas sp. AOP6]